ncbi:MAG: 2-oxoglutarate dehydrogenase E1 component [Gemmatales bacterium]
MSASTFASRWNLDVIDEQYQRWQRTAQSVDSHWQAFFEGFHLANDRAHRDVAVAPPIVPTGLFDLVDAYRCWGHLSAHLNPLDPQPQTHRFLELAQFGYTEADLDTHLEGIPFYGLPSGTLRELIDALKETYCGTLGVEYMHIQDPEIRRWFQEKMEPHRNRPSFDQEQQLRILRKLYYADIFERFLATNYQGKKRFGLEGCDTMIPVLDAMIEKASDTGSDEIVIGMPHRGRLNVLCNILRMPYQGMFAEFEDIVNTGAVAEDGDVKYHLGYSYDHETTKGNKIHLTLTPNPSHLEAVNPVVEGRVRAKQRLKGDTERKRVIPLLMHGDAAFAGQGIVTETLSMSQLQGFKTGGTLHLVVNNQVGFTTKPSDARSTTYCTDVGKIIEAPVLHVNAEDPEACVYAAELAVEFRQKFQRDVMIDLIGYRKNGHNETDDPTYTLPVMYSKIKEHKPIAQLYGDKLAKSGDLSKRTVAETEKEFNEKLTAEKQALINTPPTTRYMPGFGGRWENLKPKEMFGEITTAVKPEVFEEVARVLNTIPEGFQPHRLLGKQIAERAEQFARKEPIYWGFAEMLAYGTLLKEGHRVRLTGQDVRRGTFTHRHAVWCDARNNETYLPVNNLMPNQEATMSVYDSLLSEAAVVGFEYGFSLDDPTTLVVWEAQFGDFVNGAQIILDQFVTSSESKWRRASGLVMLLPHGMEGQGPEHSSARLERFLQCCGDNNIQVCQPTTPAQHFHMLRRQMKRGFRKPLIVMTPKSLLRLPAATSAHEEFTSGGFQEVIDDASIADPATVQRVLLCSGKVYYDLVKAREEAKKQAEVAIIRIEQLYPFHEVLVKKALNRYQAKEIAWVQEEAMNNGAWFFVEPRLREMGYTVTYCTRDASASPSVGSEKVHQKEQKELVETAIEGTLPHVVKASQLVFKKK